MKIIQLRAENFKRLKVVEITPDGALVQITGVNGSGKTSVLDAIESALAGGKHLPDEPIRRGERSATIRLDLGDVTVTRRFTPKDSSLIVEAASGARFPEPQRMLNDLISSISFDPLTFARSEAVKQLEMLKRVVTIDIDLDVLAGKRQRDYDARTEANREATRLRGQASGITVPPDLPDAPVSVDDLITAIEEAGTVNTEIETRKTRRVEAAAAVAAGKASAQERRDRAASLRAQALELDDQVASMEKKAAELQDRIDKAPALPEPVDTAPIRLQIETARHTNAGIEARVRRNDIEAQAKTQEDKSAALTTAIDGYDVAKAEAIARANMPVPGLSLGEGMVLYNGLPFSQASGAEQLRVSVAIAMAGNPKLRVLRIQHGNDLDAAGLRLLREIVEKNDFQCWIEQVDESGKIGVVMEDGAVAGAPLPKPIAADQPAPAAQAADPEALRPKKKAGAKKPRPADDGGL